MERIHDVKISENFADSVFDGSKPFELRFNDRAYQRGDGLRFKVIRRISRDDGGGFVYLDDHPLHGAVYEITCVLSGWGLRDNFVALGIAPAEWEEDEDG